MKEIDHTAHEARRARQPLNVHLTIRAPAAAPDNKGKRIISRKVGQIGEALKRRGQEHVGVTVYEKDPYLHAHHVLYVDPENDDVIARLADGVVVHAIPADRGIIEYITKQRRFLGREFEKVIRRRWEPSGGSIPGARWGATKAARAIAAAARVQIRKADIVAPAKGSGVRRPEEIHLNPVALKIVHEPRDGIGQEPPGGWPVPSVEPQESVQLLLFTELPTKPPLFSTGAEIRELREKIGLSQERLAGHIAIRDRSHLANIERGHDRLSPPRRRLLRHIVETGRLAA